MSTKEGRSKGHLFGDCQVITMTMVVLKLSDHTDLSWWWVMTPLMISVGLFILALLVLGILSLVERRMDEKVRQRRRQKRYFASSTPKSSGSRPPTVRVERDDYPRRPRY